MDCGCGGMADAADSKSAGGNIVWVQVPPSALFMKVLIVQGLFILIISGRFIQNEEKNHKNINVYHIGIIVSVYI